MLHIMEAADAVKQGKRPPTAPYERGKKKEDKSSSNYKSPKTSKNNNNNTGSSSSLYMADPSSKQALAAEQRIQTKIRGKRKTNIEERKNRTKELLFGDALKKEIEINEYELNNKNNKSPNTSTSSIHKSEKDVFVSNSKQAEAALNRLSQQKAGKMVNKKDRKQRTMELMHGDLLKNKDEVKAQPRQYQYNDVDADVAEVHQSIMNLNICNSTEKLPNTAKLLRKVITNLLKAETKDDQEKFGKLRLTNKKIKAAFVDMQYGVETLQSLGFVQKKIYNEKEKKMDDYMLFDFINVNQKALIHVMDLLNEYYPDQ